MRRFSVGLAVVVACGCATPPTQDDEATEPATAGADPYAAYDLPQVTDDWGALEYAKVRDALIEIDRNQPELLLTLAGPKGDVLARVASLPKLDEVIADMSDTKAMFEINDSIVAIYKIYAGRVAQQQPYGYEYLLLTADMMRLSTAQFASMTKILGEDALRADPIHREGLVQMRHGVAAIYLGAIQTSVVSPGIFDLSDVVIALGVVAADAAAFLLPDERRVVEQQLTTLASMGADAAQVAAMRTTIASTPMHPLIAAFADEAQAYSDKHR